MKLIESVLFKDLPSSIQDYVEVQYSYDKLSDKEIKSIKRQLASTVFELYEYDPQDKEDKEILEDHLKEKINNEGDPDMTAVEMMQTMDLTKFPILIEQGTCLEGRHRLKASLTYNLKIRAYVW